MKRKSRIRGPIAPGRQLGGGLSRGLIIVCGLALLGTGLYAAAGIFGVPWLAGRWLAQFEGGAAARIGFNPFTLTATLDDLALGNPATGTAVTAERIELNFAAASLLGLRPVLSSARVVAPELETASLSALPALARRLERSLLGEAIIDRLDVLGARIAAEAPAAAELGPFDLLLADFDAGGTDDARFRLDTRREDGPAALAFGRLSPDLTTAEGEIHLERVALAELAPHLGELIVSAAPRGELGLSAAFTLSDLLAAPVIRLEQARLQVAELALSPAAGLSVTAEAVEADARLVVGGSGDRLNLGGRIEIAETALSARDERATPAQVFAVPDAAVLITADAASDGLTVNLGGQLAGAGAVSVTALVPAATGAATRVSLSAAALPAPVVSAYATAALERGIAAGRFDLESDYALNGGRVDGTLRLVARDLAFAESASSGSPAAATGAALELAAALLEDSAGIVALELPFAGSSVPAREAAAAALRARLAAMTATPFEALAPLIASEAGAAGAIPFQPGDAALNDRALAAIEELAAVLRERPRLGLRVHGGYDAIADRDALARQQIELHVALATAGASEQAGAIDFGSARTQDVLDEFAGERLPPARVETLQGRFDCEGAMVPLCRRAYYELIFDALVENEAIAATTLSRLGRFRAASITDALAQAGIGADRFEVVPGGEIVDSPFGVGLRIELVAAGAL